MLIFSVLCGKQMAWDRLAGAIHSPFWKSKSKLGRGNFFKETCFLTVSWNTISSALVSQEKALTILNLILMSTSPPVIL